MSNKPELKEFLFTGPGVVELVDPTSMMGSRGYIERETAEGWRQYYENGKPMEVRRHPCAVEIIGSGAFRVNYMTNRVTGDQTVWDFNTGLADSLKDPSVSLEVESFVVDPADGMDHHYRVTHPGVAVFIPDDLPVSHRFQVSCQADTEFREGSVIYDNLMTVGDHGDTGDTLGFFEGMMGALNPNTIGSTVISGIFTSSEIFFIMLEGGVSIGQFIDYEMTSIETGDQIIGRIPWDALEGSYVSVSDFITVESFFKANVNKSLYLTLTQGDN